MLSNLDELCKVSKTIEKYKSEVVVIDPLYLTLLAGDDSGVSPSDQYAMGGKLGMINDVVAKAGATAILIHHYKKTTAEGVLGLNEFTYTGKARSPDNHSTSDADMPSPAHRRTK